MNKIKLLIVKLLYHDKYKNEISAPNNIEVTTNMSIPNWQLAVTGIKIIIYLYDMNKKYYAITVHMLGNDLIHYMIHLTNKDYLRCSQTKLMIIDTVQSIVTWNNEYYHYCIPNIEKEQYDTNDLNNILINPISYVNDSLRIYIESKLLIFNIDLIEK